MAESSSDSDSYLRTRAARRGPVRANHTHGRGRIAGDVSEKIHKLAHTLQDTSRNLQQVDEMLGQYREYNSDQTEAISTLKDTLEQSIDQLRSQRLSRLSGGRSASLSSLCASDLEAGGATRLLKPTSPLKDYSDVGVQRRRRSRSAVRFLDEVGNPDKIHSLHQSLRDLSSDQLRMNDDLSRELARRNRTEAETKRTLEDLTSRLNESQRQETRALVMAELWQNVPTLDDDPSFPINPSSPIREEEESATAGTSSVVEDPRIGNIDWCLCGRCSPMPTTIESLCCREKGEIIEHIPEGELCITESVHFKEMCLDSINVPAIFCTHPQNSEPPPNEIYNRQLRKMAYRTFASWLYGYLGKEIRWPIPACAVDAIRKAHPDPQGIYVGFLHGEDYDAGLMMDI